jgi:hypothetical protein
MSTATAETLAAQHHVTERTIRRDGKRNLTPFRSAAKFLCELDSGTVAAAKGALRDDIAVAIRTHKPWKE